MAKTSDNRLGGLLGAIVAVVVIGAIAGSGFYIGYLQSDAQKATTAVADPVERLRRVVLNLNEELTAVGDTYAAVSEDSAIGDPAVEQILTDKPEVFNKDATENLNQTSQLLSKVQSEDATRGTVIEGPGIASGKPNVQKEIRDLRAQYQKRNGELFKEAEAAIGAMNSAGSGSLAADRMKAIYYLARGRIEANRAAFEQLKSCREAQHAVQLAPVVAELNRDASVVAAASPAPLITATEKTSADEKTEIASLQTKIDELKQAIEAKESKLAELESISQQARKKMTELESAGSNVHAENGEYAQLSDAARKAEAEAEGIRQGTLAGANMNMNEANDLLTSPYEGGKSETGLRDFKAALESNTRQLESRNAMVTALQTRRTDLQGHSTQLQNRQKEIEGTLETQVTEVRGHLDAASKALTDAEAATKLASTAYGQAEKAARSAANAAATRTREARSAGGTATGPDAERNALIVGDGDMEASVQCLLAEISYHTALLQSRQMQAMQEVQQASSFVAKLTGGESTDSSNADVESLRTSALEKLASANKAYDEASKLIRSTTFKGEGASAQGKDYEWQVQVGQAAVHLLQAQLSSQPEESLAQRTASYDLLKSAAQGREQSPLLAPALDMLVYLQQTAK